MGSPWGQPTAGPWGLLGRRWLLLLLLLAVLLLACFLDHGTVRGQLGRLGLRHGLDRVVAVVAAPGAPEAPQQRTRSPKKPADEAAYGEDVRDAPEEASGFLVDTPGCRIPFLAPLDEAVRPFVFPVKRVHCEDSGPALVEADPRRDVLYVRRDRAHAYNISDPQRISCCSRAFWRPSPPETPASDASATAPSEYRGVDDAVEFAENCTMFPPGDALAVSDEFVRVECSDGDLVVYRDVFGFTPVKPPGGTRRAVQSQNEVEDVVDPDTPKVSILIVGVDSVSRSNLLRQMPRTLQLLRDIGAVDMMGYNKVEDNTFPNLVAILSGLSVPELRERCWPTAWTPFDDCPLIWKRFEALGYRTAYGEDEPWMGIFNYVKNGFVNQPVHHYMRPYARILLKELGSHLEYNCHLCAGPRFQLQALLDYAARFTRLAPLAPLFGLFWGVSLTHDQLNTPQLADPIYAQWLRTARDDGVLDRSVVLFLSDHGMRWGDIRETYQGRLEERLPFLMVSIAKRPADLAPRWLRKRYPSAAANLRRNSRRLLTPYDLHATLEDLMDLSRLEQRSIKERSELLGRQHRLPRSISMFVVAPDHRSCPDAGIEPHWCTCYASTPTATNDSATRRAAQFVVRRLNGMLSGFRQCASLSLDTVVHARRQQTKQAGLEPDGLEATPDRPPAPTRRTVSARVTDYLLLLRTKPGGALFEATVRVRATPVKQGTSKPSKRREQLALAGTVSRVNRYGSQSSCVANYRIKLYCFCGGVN